MFRIKLKERLMSRVTILADDIVFENWKEVIFTLTQANVSVISGHGEGASLVQTFREHLSGPAQLLQRHLEGS